MNAALPNLSFLTFKFWVILIIPEIFSKCIASTLSAVQFWATHLNHKPWLQQTEFDWGSCYGSPPKLNHTSSSTCLPFHCLEHCHYTQTFHPIWILHYREEHHWNEIRPKAEGKFNHMYCSPARLRAFSTESSNKLTHRCHNWAWPIPSTINIDFPDE